MARGRMINNAIVADKRVNELSDDTSRLAFTWLITFADREGRTYGDPAVVRSMLFPRREDVSIGQMETYIKEWNGLELIVWYEAKGDMWISFCGFEKNQVGLRKEREAASRIPAPEEPFLLRSESGLDPAEWNGSEQNESEVNDPEDLSSSGDSFPFDLLSSAGVIITGAIMADKYTSIWEDCGHNTALIESALQEAADKGTRPNPAWLRAVVERCMRDSCQPGEFKDAAGRKSRASPAQKIEYIRDEYGITTGRRVVA